MSRLLVRLGVVLTAAVALVVGGGAVAAAHVSVHADQAVQGGSSEIAFRVPTESDTASTVTVHVAFPTDTPLAEVAVLPLAGWTHEVTSQALSSPVPAGHGQEVSEVVREIKWSASGAGIRPGEYQVFRISVGSLPRTDRLVFKVVQTYDDGQVQRWIDSAADGAEPEHPAPVLALSASASASAEHAHGDVAPVAVSTPAAAPAPAWWGAVIVAMVALVAALGAVVVSIRTARRR